MPTGMAVPTVLVAVSITDTRPAATVFVEDTHGTQRAAIWGRPRRRRGCPPTAIEADSVAGFVDDPHGAVPPFADVEAGAVGADRQLPRVRRDAPDADRRGDRCRRSVDDLHRVLAHTT